MFGWKELRPRLCDSRFADQRARAARRLSVGEADCRPLCELCRDLVDGFVSSRDVGCPTRWTTPLGGGGGVGWDAVDLLVGLSDAEVVKREGIGVAYHWD